MRFQYRHFVIDATPDVSNGEFWARARIAPGVLAGQAERCVIDQSDIGRFSREALAVEYAVNWATQWIDSQDAN